MRAEIQDSVLELIWLLGLCIRPLPCSANRGPVEVRCERPEQDIQGFEPPVALSLAPGGVERRSRSEQSLLPIDIGSAGHPIALGPSKPFSENVEQEGSDELLQRRNLV